MKFNFTNSQLINYPSSDVMVDEKGDPVTVDKVITIAMFQASQADMQLAMSEKVRRYKLGRKFCAEDLSDVELSAEDVTTIKSTCGALFAPLVVGQIEEFFESAKG